MAPHRKGLPILGVLNGLEFAELDDSGLEHAQSVNGFRTTTENQLAFMTSSVLLAKGLGIA